MIVYVVSGDKPNILIGSVPVIADPLELLPLML